MAEQTYNFVTRDNTTIFPVTAAEASASNFMTMLIEEEVVEPGERFPLVGINDQDMQLATQWLNMNQQTPQPPIPKPLLGPNLGDVLPQIYVDFIYLPPDQLHSLTRAADYLQIIPLFNLCCAKICTNLYGLTTQQIKQYFGVGNVQFTAEDDEALSNMFPWYDALLKTL